MRKVFLLLTFALLLTVASARAADGIGLGFIAGSPSGISAKIPLNGIN